jgi:hypothetical protein
MKKQPQLVTGNLDMAGRPQISRLFTHNVRVDLLVEKLTAKAGAGAARSSRIYAHASAPIGYR